MGVVAARLCKTFLASSVLLVCCMTQAQTPSRPAVVELFTSQGCSSCPPAEAYVGELTQHKDVLALAFHVDYWDGLGWKDPFSLSVATARQNAYSSSLGRSSVYTPQVVIDGKDDYVGSDRRNIAKALVVPRTGVPIGISVGSENVVVELGAQENAAPGEVVLVTYLRKATSSIGHGENAGRRLEQFNIVRAIRSLGRWSGEPVSYRARLDSLPPDATDVAVLVQSSGQSSGGRGIIGAATRALR